MEDEIKNYQLYTDSIIDLASSIVLKCDDAAKSLNQWVLGYTDAAYDEYDQRTWKYYKNICGDYFASDDVMYITSLDTLSSIVFSKENLEFHRATKKAYAFGTTYYKELVAAYPQQEQLIRGILYPADMDQAISAPEMAILAYPSSLVEETEPSLIPKLQEWINGFYRRWHNPQYANAHNLYLAGMLSVLYSHLPTAIENIRLEACLTHEAHSYHVKEYLASHSKLDKYVPYMTRSQAMYFYHNLAYIENNNGRQEIFDDLLKHTFTERNLPMGHFSLVHSTEFMPGDSLTPVAVFNKKPLNTLTNIDNKNQFTLGEVLDIEDDIDSANIPYREDEEPKIAEATTYTLNPHVPTKLLQSTVIDYSDSDKYRLTDILLQHWLWLSYKNLYKAYITFTIPATGDRISLTPLDAFAFYAYAFCKGQGFDIENLPTVVCNRVQRLPTATIESMREVCEPKYVSDDWLKTTRNTMPAAPEMISVEAFRSHCNELFLAANEQYFLSALEEGMIARAQKESASCRLWGDEKFTLGDHANQTYAEWFASRNLVVRDLTNEELAELALVILKEATGTNLASVITLKDIQAYMRDLLVDLSSYSIQIGLKINAGPVLQAGFTQIRLDNIDFSTAGQQYLQIPLAEPRDITAQGSTRALINLTEFPVVGNVRGKTHKNIKFNTPRAKIGTGVMNIKINHRIEIASSFNCVVNLTAPNPRKLTIVPGMEKFLQLPLDQQLASYVDTWAM